MPAAVNHPQKILETTDVELGLNDLVPFFYPKVFIKMKDLFSTSKETDRHTVEQSD